MSHDFSNMRIDEKMKIASKLHLQFAHAYCEKIVNLLKDAGCNDADLFNCVRDVPKSCETCIKHQPKQLHSVVGLSLPKEFNDVVSIDLKFVDGKPFLHLIDNATRFNVAAGLKSKRPEEVVEKMFIHWISVFGCPTQILSDNGGSMDLKFVDGKPFLHRIDNATRFSVAAALKSKRAEEVVEKIFIHWISIFGCPQQILSDNGGEFNNGLVRELGENVNTEILTTAASSPWSNGITERHNAIIESMVNKVSDDTKCSLPVALAWSVSAKKWSSKCVWIFT